MARKSYWLGSLLIGSLILCSTGLEAEPIHDAVMDGDVKRVSELLSEGADINAPDDAGTPLQLALFFNQPEMVRLLLENEADPNVEGLTGTPLESAALSGNADIVSLLLDHGADPDGGVSSTPLYRASQKGHLKVVDLHLAKGADPAITAEDGVTPLHEAARIGQLEIAQRLVEHGADVNALTDFGKPPIHFAVLGGHTEVAAYLSERGAAPGEIEPITEQLATADVAKGEVEAEACAACHKFEMGKTYYGPTLWNVVGRRKASESEFDYSPAFRALDGDWTFDALNEFLARPTEIIPGNKMNFPGMTDPQKRANLIAFLRTLSDNPVPLPAP